MEEKEMVCLDKLKKPTSKKAYGQYIECLENLLNP